MYETRTVLAGVGSMVEYRNLAIRKHLSGHQFNTLHTWAPIIDTEEGQGHEIQFMTLGKPLGLRNVIVCEADLKETTSG